MDDWQNAFQKQDISGAITLFAQMTPRLGNDILDYWEKRGYQGEALHDLLNDLAAAREDGFVMRDESAGRPLIPDVIVHDLQRLHLIESRGEKGVYHLKPEGAALIVYMQEAVKAASRPRPAPAAKFPEPAR